MNFCFKFFVSLFAVTFTFAPSQAKEIDSIIAIVNNELVLKSDLSTYKRELKKGGFLLDDALLRFKDRQKLLSDEKYLIAHLIDEKVIDSAVKANNMQTTIEKVEQEIRRVTSKNSISRQQLIDSLKSQGVDFSKYQSVISKSLERKSLIEKMVTSNIKISDEEVISYYGKNSKKHSGQVFEYNISHILFTTKLGEELAQKKANKVLIKLKKSTKNFSKLARQFSDDPNFTEGGVLGKFTEEEMNKEIKNGVLGLEEGQVSNVVKSRFGYHIFMLTQKKLVKDPELDKQKVAIRNKLFAETLDKYFKSWLEKEKSSAFVKIN